MNLKIISGTEREVISGLNDFDIIKNKILYIKVTSIPALHFIFIFYEERKTLDDVYKMESLK